MKAYIKQDGEYYEGDRESVHDLEVPQRPSYTSIWDGSEWMDDQDKVNKSISDAALVDLVDLDKRSVRPLRTIVTCIVNGLTPDKETMEVLMGLEADAQNIRKKVIKK